MRYCVKDNGRNSKPKPWRISNLTTCSKGFHYLKIMARPAKLNADYFSHDVDMRNDIRIKGLRRNFGH